MESLSVESSQETSLPTSRISSPFPSIGLVNFLSGRGKRGTCVTVAKAEVEARMETPIGVPSGEKEKTFIENWNNKLVS